eukprot:GILI01020978.1.p1 GENE.GILI01020978.1~~GILI01020978.1.p1  ORF type:complete len:355 (-),score=35.12 GILI01020978.1:53-1117(-)
MSRRNSTASKPSEGSPNMDDVSEKPLDAFTQELVRENELLLADLESLRENEDRLISHVEQLQQQLSQADAIKSSDVAELNALLKEKDEELKDLAHKHEMELHQLREELVATKHTLSLIEDSSRDHGEQMESMQSELEEARDEIERLQSAAEETIAAMKEGSVNGATEAKLAINTGITATLSEMNSNARLMQATVQSIFKTVKGNLLFSAYGDPLAPFEEQPTPALSITEQDAVMKEADLAKIHKKIVETIRRVEGFMSMADKRCEELGMAPTDHPFRIFISTCVEGCSLLLTLFVGMGKIGLVSAKNRFSFMENNLGSTQGASSTTVAASTGSPAPSQQQQQTSTSRGLGLWVR